MRKNTLSGGEVAASSRCRSTGRAQHHRPLFGHTIRERGLDSVKDLDWQVGDLGHAKVGPDQNTIGKRDRNDLLRLEHDSS